MFASFMSANSRPCLFYDLCCIQSHNPITIFLIDAWKNQCAKRKPTPKNQPGTQPYISQVIYLWNIINSCHNVVYDSVVPTASKQDRKLVIKFLCLTKCWSALKYLNFTLGLKQYMLAVIYLLYMVFVCIPLFSYRSRGAPRGA